MKCVRGKTQRNWNFMPGAESKPQIRKVMSQMEPELFDDLLNIKLCLAKSAAKDSQSVAVRQFREIFAHCGMRSR